MISLLEKFNFLKQKYDAIEKILVNLKLDMKKVASSELESRIQYNSQSEQQFGLYTALCIETTDPWKFNRIRFFCPLFNDPNEPIDSFPWAMPCSNLGGFDDSGCNWIPPAGSTVCLMFEGGVRNSPYYMGTTWARNRKDRNGQYIWNLNIDEYFRIWEGHRKGYLAGANDESQVLPSWNTESYNGFDLNSIADFDENPEAQKRTTVPNIYGPKTPEKHMLKLVDGDPNANRKHKRIELLSGCGNGLIFKDDHINHSNTISHPSCGGGNPFFKHQNECRPYKGPGTPQNNKYDLPQSGVQILSISGQTLVFDDSVEEPEGTPGWERSVESFGFGQTDKFLGRIYIKTATGHTFEMSDKESASNVRGEENFIRLKTACGSKIELNDHTVGTAGCQGCPPNLAGEKRGITLESTSKHLIEMIDEDNEQCSPCRKEGGVPVAKAKKAFVRIRSGYGMQIELNDANSQEKTVAQFLQIFCPQKDNSGPRGRGPHLMRFQEKPSGPGQIFLRAGGNYVISTHDNSYEIVGDSKNPSNKVEVVSKDKIEVIKNKYLNKAISHMFLADDKIGLLAGLDCENEDGEKGPCIAPVVVCQNGKLKISDRVFATASPEAKVVSIFCLTTDPLPFISSGE